MVEDNRFSRSPKSGVVTFTSGDAGTAKDLVPVRDGVSFSTRSVFLSYDSNGTQEARVSLYDDDEGTSAGSVSGEEFSVILGPGDGEYITQVEGIDFDDDVVAVVENNDNDVDITLSGMLLEG